jgi:hypothetical protein
MVVLPQLSFRLTFGLRSGNTSLQESFKYTLSMAGQFITGGWLSTTVTVKLQDADAPLAAVTLNVLVVTPTGNIDPEAKPAI